MQPFIALSTVLGAAVPEGAVETAEAAGWQAFIAISYLVAAVLFILGLKMLSSPKTARRGNFTGAVGMLIAIVVTLIGGHYGVGGEWIVDYKWIAVGLIVGALIGAVSARAVQMTAMPQMVALFNGLGGAASMFVGLAELERFTIFPTLDISITLILGVLVGAVTLSGSYIAFDKLQGLFVPSRPITFKGQQFFNMGLLVLALVVGVWFILYADPTAVWLLAIVAVIGLLLGITAVIPIGGADMPVVICLLNAYSGVAAAMTGFVLENSVLIISGALVGASGLILTDIMTKAMNRSWANVLFGAVGVEEGAELVGGEQKTVVSYTAQDAATMLGNANSVIIIPGYGLAVAHAQHVVKELADILLANGTDVRFAIHPVAGRMPGHMNILLAEAEVPYDRLLEMDAINDDFKNTDVALVVGANDVVNPSARYKKSSPLYGMPILNADQAQTVIVLKRSLRPGFAGEDNDLFYLPKTMMTFGDAKKTITDIVQNIKSA